MSKNSPGKNSRKRMRLPNGFGRITKIKGRLRKPYRAMVTVGKDENGKPIGKLLKPQAYFDTYNEAYAALLEYNKDPMDLARKITFEEVYKKWSDKRFEELSANSVRRHEIAFRYCNTIKNMDIREIRIRHLRRCIDEGFIIKDGKKNPIPEAFKINVKLLFNQVFAYAMEYEYLERNIAKDLKVKMVKTSNPHMSFTKEEMEILWSNTDDQYVRALLILCYSGMRPGELFKLEKKNIDFDNHTMVGGSKTEAGINRIIPIHPLIEAFIKRDIGNLDFNYEQLRFQLKQITKHMGLCDGHRLHDGRKHFITLAKKYDVDEYALKRIVGHKITDLTESVYTERDPSWLFDEICKIKQY